MFIKKKRINSKKYFLSAKANEPLFIKVGNVSRFANELKKFGFDENSESGTCILPNLFNRYAKMNAEPYYTINRSLPKEKYIQTLYWTRREWAGRGETREVTEFIDIEKTRFHRDWHNPFCVNFTYVSEDEAYIISDGIIYDPADTKRLMNTVNMVLGLFGECDIDFEPVPKEIKKVRLNWDILPPGKYPWDRIKPSIHKISQKSNKTQKAMMLRNCEVIVSMEPEFVAYGRSGFKGYVVFGFPKRSVYILESIYPNNATYVFENDWEMLSKLSKAEILSNNLQKERIIHSAKWEQNFREFMSKP